MNKFHHTVNLIIDPSAYCQIILDDVQERIAEMSNCLDNRQDITQSQVQIVVQRALSLSRQISDTIEDIGQENIDKQTIMIVREFKAAIYETDAASKKFLVNKATPPEQLRVISRCEIMLKVIERLLPILSVIVNNSITMNTTTFYNKSTNGQGDFPQVSMDYLLIKNLHCTFALLIQSKVVNNHFQFNRLILFPSGGLENGLKTFRSKTLFRTRYLLAEIAAVLDQYSPGFRIVIQLLGNRCLQNNDCSWSFSKFWLRLYFLSTRYTSLCNVSPELIADINIEEILLCLTLVKMFLLSGGVRLRSYHLCDVNL